MPAVTPLSRAERWSGVAFVALAFLSSTAISLPLSTDTPLRIGALYDEHRIAYVAAQVVGLAGVLMLLIFLKALRKRPETAGRSVTIGGLLTAAAAVSTNVAVLVLCFADLSLAGLHRAAAATEITDDVLFASFSVFALALARSGLPRWMRALAALASLLCIGRAISPWLSIPALPVVAPMLVLLVLLIVGIRVLRAPDDSGVRATLELSVIDERLSAGTAC